MKIGIKVIIVLLLIIIINGKNCYSEEGIKKELIKINSIRIIK